MYQTQQFNGNHQHSLQSNPVRILLVDDQRVIREGLKSMLAPFQKLLVVGTANDGQVAIEQVEALQPDVVLMDIQMPVMDGVTATRIITQEFAETKVLVLSSQGNDYYLAQILEAGAKGYLLKDTPGIELATAIEAVHFGYGHIGPGVFKKFNSRLFAINDVALKQVPFESTKPESFLEQVNLELTTVKSKLDQSFGHQQFLELQLGLTRVALRKQQRDLQEFRKLLNIAFWIAVIALCPPTLLFVLKSLNFAH